MELDARAFAKSTLQEFRAQLVLHEEPRALFQRSLELAKRRGKFRGDRQLKVALDTTNILGRGAVKDTYPPEAGWRTGSGCWRGRWRSRRGPSWRPGPSGRGMAATSAGRA